MTTDLKSAQREYVLSIMDRLQITATELARRAGISHPTITTLINHPDRASNLSSTTMAKIAAVAAGLPGLRAPIGHKVEVTPLPVTGAAAVGVWRESSEMRYNSAESFIPVMTNPAHGREQYGIVVHDASADQHIPKGAYGIFEKIEADRIEPGDLVHVRQSMHGLVEDTVRRADDVAGELVLSFPSRDRDLADREPVSASSVVVQGRLIGVYTEV